MKKEAYYFCKPGMAVPLGPVSRSELIDKVRRQQVTYDYLVWKEGMEDWVYLDQVIPAGIRPCSFSVSHPSFLSRQGFVPRKPERHMFLSVLATCCCCLPTGIIAVFYSARVHALYRQGEYAAARRSADRAWLWICLSFGFALAFFAFCAIFS